MLEMNNVGLYYIRQISRYHHAMCLASTRLAVGKTCAGVSIHAVLPKGAEEMGREMALRIAEHVAVPAPDL